MNMQNKILLILFVAMYCLMILIGNIIPTGSLITQFVNIALFCFLCFNSILKPKTYRTFGIIYLYLIFILVLSATTSSNPHFSLKMWMKYANGLLAFPAGFVILRTTENREILNKFLILCLILFIANMAIANIIGLGESVYGEKAVKAGNLFDNALYTNICALTLTPIYLYYCKNRNRLLLLLILNIVLSLICFKRTIYLCLFGISVVFYFSIKYLNLRYGNAESFKGLITLNQKFIIVILLFLCVALLGPKFLTTYEYRRDVINAGLSEQTRTRELIDIFYDITYSSSDRKFFLGQETFNTVGTYAGGRYGGRMIHENYGIMMNGAGYIGLAFLLFITVYTLWIFLKLKKTCLWVSKEIRFYYCSYWALWVNYLLASFSGTFWLGVYPVYSFALMGMIYRLFYDLECRRFNQ